MDPSRTYNILLYFTLGIGILALITPFFKRSMINIIVSFILTIIAIILQIKGLMIVATEDIDLLADLKNGIWAGVVILTILTIIVNVIAYRRIKRNAR